MLVRVYEKTVHENCEHLTMTDRTIMISPEQYRELDMGREVTVPIPDTTDFFRPGKIKSMKSQTLRLKPCHIKGGYYGPMGKLMGVMVEEIQS